MEKLIDLLFDNGDVWALLGVCVLGFLLNLNNIQRFFLDRRRARLQFITEALTSPYVTGRTREYLQRRMEEEYFYVSTGMAAEKEFREAIIELHSRANGELRFKHFQRAIQYMKYENGLIRIKISVVEWLGVFYNSAASLLLAGFGLFCLLAPVYSKLKPFEMLTMYGLCILCWGISVILFMQLFPFISAIYVRKVMRTQALNG